MHQIHNGDCADVMASMESNSVDAIVTDPPYGLSFMGAKWDSFNGGIGNQTISERQAEGKRYADENKGAPRHGKKVTQGEMVAFQAAMTPIFEEALRVAKPGAHLLCFGGTRTFHRMACAIEDAGWEIRDCIMWVYGCLDEETEVLVDGEFVPYNKAKKGRLALGYDIGTGNFSWQRIEDTYLYDYDDTAYAIQSDCTDQLVSRNHRCIVERGGVEQFALAELVALEREASVPVLEGLHGLFDHLPLPDERAGGAQQDVLEGVRCESRELGTEEAQGSRAERDVCYMRQEVLHASSMDTESKRATLLKRVQRKGSRNSIADIQQGAPNTNVRRAEAGAQGANDWRTEPSMEGRGDVPSSQGQLREREVREVSSGISVDGSQGRVRDGASFGRGASDRQTTCSDGSCSSRQSRSVGQQARESDAIPEQQGAQALRGAWGAKTTLARVMPVHYKGKMWCIKVATGAFVARRHGKIFVTGNSGFPKSMDVAKAIEKQAGVRSNYGHAFSYAATKRRESDSYTLKSPASTNGKYEPEPLTMEEAKQWEGWGTCLKPAWEPIIVARKPLDGTVAHNVLTWGVGALNIDACRVAIEQGDDVFAKNPHTRSKGKDSGIYGRYDAAESDWSGAKGRFPANLVHDGSQMVLDLFPEANCGKSGVIKHKKDGVRSVYGDFSPFEQITTAAYGGKGSAARFFYCAKASKKERGEGNHHPTIKPIALMKWLVTLVTPEGGVVLDPFAGSGTTLLACKELGRSCIGIEREPEYVEIIKRRLGE